LPVRVAGTNRNILMRDTDLALDDLSDVAITSLLRGQQLTYDGTNWVNSTIPFSGGNDMPSAVFATQGAGTGAALNLAVRIQIPHETSYYRYMRVWIVTSATSTSLLSVGVYEGAPAAGGLRKCFSNIVQPAVNLFQPFVLDLSQNIITDLIFQKNTDYTLIISVNQPVASGLVFGNVTTTGVSNTSYAWSSTTNYLAAGVGNQPTYPVNCPVGAVVTNRFAFVLSNTP